MTEIWLPVPGASDYEISSMGRVRSLDRSRPHVHGGQRALRGKVLKPHLDKVTGYLMVTITMDDGHRRNRGVHNQMCRAFHGLPPTPKHEARHLNGVKVDNTPENLAWGTKSQNAFDMVRHGTHPNARKTHCPKRHRLVERLENGRPHRRCLECERESRRLKSKGLAA